MSQRSAIVVLALGILAVAAVGVALPATADAAPAGEPAVVQEVDLDDVLLSISVDADGNAAWTIEYRTRLDTDDDEAAFEEFREDVEADPDAYAGEFHDRMTATAADAEEATGREMAVTEMTVSVERRELPREYGIVTYSFHWSNFAVVDGDRLTIGDAIDGLFLDDASELRIAWPDGYGLVEASPAADETRSGSVVWHGPTSFASGEPRVVVNLAAETTPLALLVVLLAVGVAAAYARRRGSTLALIGAFGGSAGDGSVEPGAAAAGEESDDEADGAKGEAAAGTDEADGEATEDAADESGADAGAGAADIDPELLSNEEQVLRLIRENGGRMKQKQVAEELDWTAAKTSQVTKGLREEGELEGFRLGRENVLALPEADPR
ncbi:helix-turn-helix transcriptional regulator [Halorubrum gandharaense]